MLFPGTGEAKPPQAAVEGAFTQAGAPQGLLEVNPLMLPLLHHSGEIFRRGHRGPAEPNAPGLGRGDALRLPLADIHPLIFRHEGEHLEHDVAEEGAHEILAPSRVQQGHVQHRDVHPLLLGEHTPLL